MFFINPYISRQCNYRKKKQRFVKKAPNNASSENNYAQKC